MNIYLDSTATTEPRKEVVDEVVSIMSQYYGNPSSLHRMGLDAEKKMNKSREIISNALGVNRDEIYFTSGGTESNNLAIQGVLKRHANRGAHVITTEIEHPSVLNTIRSYESDENLDITYLKVNQLGQIDLEEFREVLRGDTVLVSIMMVNNEVGAIQPIGEISKIIRELNPNCYLHVDGVQAFGKLDLNLSQLGVDMFSFSGHKIHGPKGIGGLYVRKGVKISPLLYGGGQEKGLSPGTQNTSGIVGMAKALEVMVGNREEKNHVSSLKEYLIERIASTIDEVKVNSPANESFTPYMVNLSFPGTRGEIVLHTLESKGIYVSTTSACSSKDKKESHVLKAMGISSEDIEGSIRVSFSYKNTYEELDTFVAELKHAVEEIRSIMR